MSRSNLPAPRSSNLLAAFKGDQTANEVADAQKAAFVERARRSAERDLALLEMTDVEALTVRGIAAAGNMAAQAVAEIEGNPYSASGVGRLLDTGNGGLNRALRRYLDEE